MSKNEIMFKCVVFTQKHLLIVIDGQVIRMYYDKQRVNVKNNIIRSFLMDVYDIIQTWQSYIKNLKS